jgi:hypothetical protein
MVDPEKEYDVIDIAFYFVGRGIDAQKSEKLLTIVCPSGQGSTLQSAINAELTGKE